MFDPQTLLSTYRVLLRRSRRFVDASAWILLAGIVAFVALAWLGPTRERGASDTADAIATGCKLLLVFGAAAVLAGMGKFTPWQAKRLGLVCPECGRPLTAATIEYALDTGDCWHCRPPVPVEVVEPDAPLPPESGNPYQPPTTTEPHPAESAADVQPQAAASPISTPLMLLFGGPVAYLLIWQSLAGDDETWWKNNRLPADRYPTPEAEAEHRAQFLRAVRRHGWYQLVPLVAIPAVATWLMLVYAPQPMHKFDFVIGSMGVFLLSSSAAYQAASLTLAWGPRSLRRWVGGNAPPVKSAIESESQLECVPITFPLCDLSPLPASRRIRFRWRTAEPRPLCIRLWRKDRGVVHQQELPPPEPGQWTDARATIPLSRAGEDARWSEIKILLVLDPPGDFEIDEFQW
jgi:hypothetical protein